MIKRIMILVFLTTFLISCEKETIEKLVYKEKEYSWKQDLRFSGESSILLNSFASDEKLSISAINHWATIDSSNEYYGVLNFESYLGYSIERKIPITKTLFAYYSELGKSITFRATDNFIDSYVPTFFIEDYDTNVLYLNDLSNFRKNEFAVINESNYCLVPYMTESFDASFLLIKPEINYYDGFEVDINHDKSKAIVRKFVIEREESKGTNYVRYLTTYKNKFFVGFNNELYQVDTLGIYEMILPQGIYQIINKSDSLIAIAGDNTSYLSINGGDSWTNFHEFPQDDFSGTNGCYHNYVVIDNEIIAYPRCDIGLLYHVSIKNNSFQIDTIPSDGLRYKDITSISEFNGKVYVTTLSGLFYKDLDKLLKYEN